jgi:hypothetical protein
MSQTSNVQFFIASIDLIGKIRVFVRVRPLIGLESIEKRCDFKIIDNLALEVGVTNTESTYGSRKKTKQCFEFGHILDTNARNLRDCEAAYAISHG